MQSPAERGYFMPAEWQKHTATWLAWPHNKADWPDKFAPIPWVYGEIIRNLTQHERVRLLVKNSAQQTQAKDILKRANVDLSKVDFYIIPTNRIWMRDAGPTFLVNKDKTKKPLLLNWRFNAWAKYPNHKLDDKIPTLLGQKLKREVVTPTVILNGKEHHVVLEGGAIDVNGKGTILTTEECLLSKTQERNPGFTRTMYEDVFADFLGCPNTIWLDKGIVGDDTHGHVDDLARFTDERTVVVVSERNKKDVNYKLLQENVKRLEAAKDQDGKKLRVVELPMPKPVIFEGERLPASYANFLIANNIVLVPTFNDSADREALNILAQLFPSREIIGIHCVDFVWGLGTIHCMSQQEPA